MSRLAIYTALTGGYDNLRQPETVRTDADYICFSNDIRDEKVGVWTIRPIQFEDSDPVRVSRFPKLNPHLVLSEYEASLYVDANVLVTEELDDAMNRAIASQTPCAMVPHPDRKGTYEEGMFLLRHSMGEPFKVYRQIKELVRTGFKDDAGLFVCSLLFRRHLDPCVITFSENWWRGFQMGAKRDQLSVMPALKAAGLVPDTLVSPDYVRNNTAPHAAHNHHSLVWHGWHFTIRTILSARMKRIFAVYRADARIGHRVV